MVKGRSGHSLPELLVTLAFLGVSMGAVTAALLHGGRNTAAAAATQEAIAVAAATLDSLTSAAVAAPDSGVSGRFRVRWEVRPIPSGEDVEVTVVAGAAARPIAVLRGVRTPQPPGLALP